MFVHGMGVTVGLLLALLYVPPQEPASEGEVSAR
jgi:hypothetical protein